MTDAEIIKALECCSTNNQKCYECPLHLDCMAGVPSKNISRVALDLIQRQQKEIERLSNFVTEERCREIAKEYFQPIAKQTRAGTVKEFVDRMKEKVYTNNYCQEVVLEEDINNIAREMVGESDDR